MSKQLVKAAWPAMSVSVCRAVAPSLRVTVPLGVPVPGETALTAAVRVSPWPYGAGLAEPARGAIVAAVIDGREGVVGRGEGGGGEGGLAVDVEGIGGQSGGAVLEGDGAGRRARPGHVGGDRRGGVAKHAGVDRRGQRGGGGELIDDLGEDQRVGAGVEIGIIIIDGRDRVRAGGEAVGRERGGGVGGPGREGYGAENIGSVFESGGAGGDAAAGNQCADAGGEGDRIAEQGGIGGGGDGVGGAGLVDDLGDDHRGGRVEVSIVVIDGGDGMRTNREG